MTKFIEKIRPSIFVECHAYNKFENKTKRKTQKILTKCFTNPAQSLFFKSTSIKKFIFPQVIDVSAVPNYAWTIFLFSSLL
jgi:hypothetical protein